MSRFKEGESIPLWILYYEGQREGIYTNKVQAEADLRELKQDSGGYKYRLIETYTVPYEGNR